MSFPLRMVDVSLQLIHLRGHLVAARVGEIAVVTQQVPHRDLALVRAMCVFALAIAAGQRPGPYDDKCAEAWARAGLCKQRQRRRVKRRR